MKITPIVKWAGGKRWLTRRYGEVFPSQFNRLVEPFLGGASVFLFLQPKRALLSDINSDLIMTYEAIKQDWKAVQDGLAYHNEKHSKVHYYEVRHESPKELLPVAIRFLYLNRTCWNGLYRVNKSGRFNVPIGTKSKVLLDTDDFQSLSNILNGDIEFYNQEFRKTFDLIKSDDLVYVDPPYTVNHNKNGFLKYNEAIFSWDDQLMLRNKIENAAILGAKIIVSQASHESIQDLYKGIGTIQTVTRNSILAAKSKYRNKVDELIISVNC